MDRLGKKQYLVMVMVVRGTFQENGSIVLVQVQALKSYLLNYTTFEYIWWDLVRFNKIQWNSMRILNRHNLGKITIDKFSWIGSISHLCHGHDIMMGVKYTALLLVQLWCIGNGTAVKIDGGHLCPPFQLLTPIT